MRKAPWRKVTAQPDGETAPRQPGHLFGGRVRTSTAVLIAAFFLVWWAYDTYRPAPEPPPAPQVVPPGFVPDPNYTWVPRTKLQQPPTTITRTVTVAPTPTETITPPSEPEPPPPLLPFPLPPPFGPAPASTPAPPVPGASPEPLVPGASPEPPPAATRPAAP